MTSESYERLLKLAHQRAIDGKGGLAASIAKMCLDARADLSEDELRLTFEILRQLIDKVEVQIRRYISDYLADRTDVPHDLIRFLAEDVINVAYPVLVHSAALTEDDLLEVAEKNGEGHQLAISKRSDLSEAVTDKLIEGGSTSVLQQVLGNSFASISSSGFAHAVVRSMTEASLHEPLLSRKDLPLSVPALMHGFVGDALREFIDQKFPIASADLNDAVASAVNRLLEEKRTSISWSDADGRNHDQRILGVVESKGEEGLRDVLSKLIGLDRNDLEVLLGRDTGTTLATVLCAFGLTKDQYSSVLARIYGTRKMDKMRESGALDKLLGHFTSLRQVAAQNMVAAWCDAEERILH